ncbi:MAG TPA: acetamidase/formamidase family protein [bacterium]|nr:acetamidase/formamidase family protein [bacterium]
MYHTSIGTHAPVLTIASGSTVITTTVDARGMDATGKQVTERGNPQTGPFFVEGAEPGDMLSVTFDRLRPNRKFGWSASAIAPNVLEPESVKQAPDEAPARWEIDQEAGTATLVEPRTALGRLALPMRPMVGCFGVAPPRGQAISTATSSTHGGNMDYRGFVEGVTVHFPVFVPGALLHVGDGHALQGDGEIVGTGIEISFDIQFTVRLVKGKALQWPRAENADEIMTVGNARPLDQCVQHATTEMVRWLQEDYGLDARGAHLLLGQCARYELGNMYDPAYTMVCKVSKSLLAGLEAGR